MAVRRWAIESQGSFRLQLCSGTKQTLKPHCWTELFMLYLEATFVLWTESHLYNSTENIFLELIFIVVVFGGLNCNLVNCKGVLEEELKCHCKHQNSSRSQHGSFHDWFMKERKNVNSAKALNQLDHIEPHWEREGLKPVQLWLETPQGKRGCLSCIFAVQITHMATRVGAQRKLWFVHVLPSRTTSDLNEMFQHYWLQ